MGLSASLLYFLERFSESRLGVLLSVQEHGRVSFCCRLKWVWLERGRSGLKPAHRVFRFPLGSSHWAHPGVFTSHYKEEPRNPAFWVFSGFPLDFAEKQALTCSKSRGGHVAIPLTVSGGGSEARSPSQGVLQQHVLLPLVGTCLQGNRRPLALNSCDTRFGYN